MCTLAAHPGGRKVDIYILYNRIEHGPAHLIRFLFIWIVPIVDDCIIRYSVIWITKKKKHAPIIRGKVHAPFNET